MGELRPMRSDDVERAEQVWYEAVTTLRATQALPGLPRTPELVARERRRIAHTLSTDPAGCWVAEDEGELVGLSQALVRDGIWVLSILGVLPGEQSSGVGRALLDAARRHGTEARAGIILASRDPRAVRRYLLAGFDARPCLTAWGRLVAGAAQRVSGQVRPGDDRDLDLVDDLDRRVRGGTRRVDIGHLLGNGGRLMVHDAGGYAIVRAGRVGPLAAATEKIASEVLVGAWTAATEEGADVVEAGWLTGDQQWALRTAVAAGLELHPAGPLMVRGDVGPLRPYVANGAFG